MKELAFVSGRNSAGKESLMAVFLKFASKAVIADCSLEFNGLIKMLRPENALAHALSFSRGFFYDQQRCTHCRMCMGVCFQHAIEFEREEMVFHEYRCTHCGSCIKWCPMMALRHDEQSDADVYSANTRFGPLVFSQGIFEPSLQFELIRYIRQHAYVIAKDLEAPYLFINGSRGLRITSYAAVENADAIIAVISPAPYALLDLEKIIRFCRQSGLDPMVIINMSDLDLAQSKELEEYCNVLNVNVIGRIPYEVDFGNALEESQSLGEFLPDSRLTSILHDTWVRMINYI